jgi:hypothetical protein
MKRRDFIATSSVAAMAAGSMVQAADTETATAQQFIELRQYHQNPGSRREPLEDYLKNAALPAWNRAGITPVGVFTVMYGQNQPSLYVLLPHPSWESVLNACRTLANDEEYQQAAKEFEDVPLSDPLYLRYESCVMRAFKNMPQVEVPERVQGKGSRLFEMRTYESHSEKAAKKKIEMFNEGGEIAIFRKTGLDPVFFGESLIGRQLPNLTYMLSFPDMATRDQAWAAFVGDPDWKALSGDPQYKDTVSTISDIILRPTSYSQI